jgi:hypothetical protein
MRKFTAAAAIAGLLACTSISAPAFAGGDGVGLGIGLGVLLLDQIAKGSKGHAGGRQPGRGDTLIGRVGDGDSQGSRNSGSRKRNNVAPAEQFAAVPENGPVIEFRPDPATLVAEDVPAPIDDIETAATDLTPASIPEIPQQPVKQSGPAAMSDEYGVYWGNVDAATADKIDQATKLGMKRSQAIQALSGLPMPEDAKINADADAAKLARAEAKAKAEAEKAQADAQAAAEAKAKADAAELDALLANQAKATRKPVDAVSALPSTETPVAGPEATQDAATAEKAVAPDLDLGATAAVEKTEPATPAEQPKKSKLDLDL